MSPPDVAKLNAADSVRLWVAWSVPPLRATLGVPPRLAAELIESVPPLTFVAPL